ncbi:MAG TPA: XRE family transcriptional regulator [Verrucomicrobiae bacterium]|nr:XRE family transcriptional regulator [Verrucomicrobiae bacterium]
MIKNLGQKIRQIRKTKSITLVEMAEKTGVAQATLSRIETGTMTGTLESHEKIAEVLGIGLAELYSGMDKRYEEVVHTTSAAERKVTHHSHQVQVELLTHESSKKKITPLMITLQGKSSMPTEHNERGVEKFLFVLQGEVKVTLENREYTLKENETLYFDASIPHQISNEQSGKARLLAAVSPSKI